MRQALNGHEPERGDVKGALALWPFKNEVDAWRAMGMDIKSFQLETPLMDIF